MNMNSYIWWVDFYALNYYDNLVVYEFSKVLQSIVNTCCSISDLNGICI